VVIDGAAVAQTAEVNATNNKKDVGHVMHLTHRTIHTSVLPHG